MSASSNSDDCLALKRIPATGRKPQFNPAPSLAAIRLSGRSTSVGKAGSTVRYELDALGDHQVATSASYEVLTTRNEVPRAENKAAMVPVRNRTRHSPRGVRGEVGPMGWPYGMPCHENSTMDPSILGKLVPRFLLGL